MIREKRPCNRERLPSHMIVDSEKRSQEKRDEASMCAWKRSLEEELADKLMKGKKRLPSSMNSHGKEWKQKGHQQVVRQ